MAREKKKKKEKKESGIVTTIKENKILILCLITGDVPRVLLYTGFPEY